MRPALILLLVGLIAGGRAQPYSFATTPVTNCPSAPLELVDPSELSAAGLAALASQAEEQMALLQTLAPGNVAALAYNGEVVAQRMGGYADTASQTPPTMSTAFQVGSVSKLMTAAMVYQMRDAGALASLDTPLTELGYANFTLQGAEADAGYITVRSLLRQLSGIAREAPVPCLANGCPGATTAEVVDLLADVPPTYAPWEQPSYSNLGFALVGRIVAEAAGLTFEQALSQYLLEPLGMSDSGSYNGSWVPANGATAYYYLGPGQFEAVPWSDLGWETPCGGLYSTGADLLTLNEALLGNMPDVFLPSSARELNAAGSVLPTSVAMSGGERVYVGSPVESLVIDGHPVRCKGGVLLVFGAFTCTVPSLGLSTVALVNTGHEPSEVAYTVLQTAIPMMEALLQQAQPQPALALPADPSLYEGEWGGVVDVTYDSEAERMYATFPGQPVQFALSYQGGDVFSVELRASYPDYSCPAVFLWGWQGTKLTFSLSAGTLQWPEVLGLGNAVAFTGSDDSGSGSGSSSSPGGGDGDTVAVVAGCLGGMVALVAGVVLFQRWSAARSLAGSRASRDTEARYSTL